ncbi:MAG: SDR family oxidoreductase [bacterium]
MPADDASGAGAARRTAIVTGGASGIGEAIAEALARNGVAVWLADRQLALAEQVAMRIRAVGGAATAVELDVRDAPAFHGVVERVIAQAGRLDYLFNNAGIAVTGEAREYVAADWDDVIDINLRGVTNGIQAAYPTMIRQGFGHIINTASMAGLVPVPMQASYSATKSAVVALSRVLRIEARAHGVRVSVLCPAAVRTPILNGGRYGRYTPSLDAAMLAPLVERLRPFDPARLALRVLRAVARNRAIIVEPRWARLVWYIGRLSPGLVDRLSGQMLAQLRRDVLARGGRKDAQ